MHRFSRHIDSPPASGVSSAAASSQASPLRRNSIGPGSLDGLDIRTVESSLASGAVAPSAAPRRALLHRGLARLIRRSAPRNNHGNHGASDKDQAHAHRTLFGWQTEDKAAASAHAPHPAPTPSPASSDVEVVPGPPRPIAELIDVAHDDSDADVADDDSDVSGGSSGVHDEVADNSDVGVVGGTDAEHLSGATDGHGYGKPAGPRFASLALTPSSPPSSSPLPTWREHTSRKTRLPFSFYVNETSGETVRAKPTAFRGSTSEANAAVVPAPAPVPTPSPAPHPIQRGRLRGPRATPTPTRQHNEEMYKKVMRAVYK